MCLKTKKITVLLMMLVMILSAAALQVYAENAAGAQTSVVGDGTSKNPYLIATEEELLAIATGELDNALSSHYILQNDITVTSSAWVPIGGATTFSGTFDGNGYTVSGIYLENSSYDYSGFFGTNTGTIKNLTVSGTVSSSQGAGLLVNINYGTVQNCTANGAVSGGSFVGLIAGISYGTVTSCTANGEVSGSDSVGLLVGASVGSVESCFSSGTVTGTGSSIGGLIGDSSGAIRASGSTAAVTGSQFVGGLSGSVGGETITDCYAQGDVTGSNHVGGLCGQSGATVRNCYASGKVNNSTGAGLIDYNGGRIYNSYYRATNPGNQIGYAVSVSNLRVQSTFYMWDFDNIWEMEDGGFPYINVRGTTPEIEFDGDGDAEYPYIIETEAQLHALAMGYAQTGEHVYYQLKNDIEITARCWMPIGEYNSFIGIFDGNGHTVSGLKISGTDYETSGLFGTNDGTVKNLTVTGTVNGSSNVGLIAGKNNGTVASCTAKGDVSGNDSVGLLVGISTGTVETCFSSGTVTGTGYCVGGLIGDSSGVICTSGSTAAVAGGQYVGGLAGSVGWETITDCYARGDVTGSNFVGGLCGQSGATVQNCYASGKVSADQGAGLIYYNGGSVLNSYYNGDDNLFDTDIGTPLSIAEMKTAASYADWDFADTWAISEHVNDGYPYLQALASVERIPVTDVTLDITEMTLKIGETATLSATVVPANATEQAVIWTSSDTSVAAIADGVITAKAAGSIVITVTTADGAKAAVCTVTVKAEETTTPEPDENAPRITVSEAHAKAGQEITVTVDLADNIGFANLAIEIGYNASVLTLTNVTSNSVVGATFTPAEHYTANPYNMNWISTSNIMHNGTLATLTFTVNENAPDGIYPITVDYYKGREGNYVDGEDLNYDENDKAVGFVYIDGSVKITRYLPGDINGDEVVNNKDATALLRYLAGWTIEVVTDALDVDGNGTINNKDASHLLRYLAGWDIMLSSAT